jgi:hypothetical protein
MDQNFPKFEEHMTRLLESLNIAPNAALAGEEGESSLIEAISEMPSLRRVGSKTANMPVV